MSLKQRINDDLKAAMRGGDARRRDALRLILAALKQREVDERKELAEPDVVTVIDKMIKQRREAIAQFEKGGRQDLAEKEQFELGVLQAYMPQALSEAEIEAAVAEAIAAAGAKATLRHGQGDGSAQRQTGRTRRHVQSIVPGEGEAGRVVASIHGVRSA